MAGEFGTGAGIGAGVGAVYGGSMGGFVGAGIGAVIGAVIGACTYLADFDSNKKALKKQIHKIEENRDNYLALLDTKWDISKKDALQSADRQDVYTTRDEERLNDSTNLELKQLQLQQQENANAANLQAQQNSAQHGARLAQIAASGTRNSTMTQAAEMQNQQAAEQLQATENNARQATDYTRRRIINNFLQSQNNIQKQRDSAMETREQFAKGGADKFHGSTFGADGSKYQLYKYQRWYDKNQFDTAINELKDQYHEMTSAAGFWGGLGKSLFGGSTQNFGGGYQIGTSVGFLWEGKGK